MTWLVVITNNIISENAAFSGGGIELDSGTKSFVADNLITGNSAALYGAGVEIYSSSVTALRNRFEGNNATGAGGALSIWSSTTATITDNAMRNNTAQQGGAIYLTSSSAPVIANNTIFSNAAPSGGGILNSPKAIVVNNLVAFNSSGISYDSSGLHNNCVFDNHGLDYEGVPDQTGTNGNISVDPLLVSSNDFHLAAGSPCINAGDDSLIEPGWTDLDGQARKAGAHVDIGADEFGSSLPFTLTQLAGPTSGEHVLRLTGETGQTYVFERGSGFTDWTPINTNAAPTGVIDFPVSAPEGPTQYYYRALTLVP